MSDEQETPSSFSGEMAQANARLALDLSKQEMPLDISIRIAALTLAQRHTGDTTVKEGNLYEKLKFDNKLVGPLTVEHVIGTALVFERFLWGEFSKGIAADAMANVLREVDEVISKKLGDEPPTRPHAGEAP